MAFTFYFTSSVYSLSNTPTRAHTHISWLLPTLSQPPPKQSPFDYELLVLSHQNSSVSFINLGSLCWVCSSKTYNSVELELIPHRISVITKIKLNIQQNIATINQDKQVFRKCYINQCFPQCSSVVEYWNSAGALKNYRNESMQKEIIT